VYQWFCQGGTLANEGNFPKMPDSAKFSVPLSSLNHCLTSFLQIRHNYGFAVLCNYGFTAKLIACQTISWKG